MKINPIILFVNLSLISSNVFGQGAEKYHQVEPRRFIDKVEFVIGAGLCFNHGSMFTENYRGEFANGNYVENKRLSKIGFSVGIGVYHPVNDKIDINVRLLWEQKGYKSELNTTLGSNSREFRESEYTYNYFTLPITAKLFIDKKRRFAISLGGYISQINSVSTTEKFYNTLDNMQSESSFIGRTIVSFDVNGGINSASFIPGLQGFAEYDYGLVYGVSYEFKFGERNGLLIQLVDNFGFANVNKPNFTIIPSPFERNHIVSLMVGYMYKRKSKH